MIPAANQLRHEQITSIIEDEIRNNGDFNCDLKIVDGETRECLLASQAVLIASGTATLEAMLCKRPMVVGYKMAKMTRFMMGYLYKPTYFALPNLLADKLLVTELLQEDVNAERLAEELLPLFGEQGSSLKAEFSTIHQQLKKDADKQAASAILSLLGLESSQ